MTRDEAGLPREEVALCAHDLRGALTIIAGYSALLRRDDLSEADRTTALDGIDAAIVRADALVGDTLAGRRSARITHGLVDLDVLARRAAEDTRVTFERDVSVSTKGAPSVHGDAVALARVLENLLSNAAKYAPDGVIEVSVLREGDHAIIEVADRGPGIPTDDRIAILEPFARLPRDDEVPGTGLGLTVVRSVAESMGGHVQVLGRTGGGTVVRVEVPITDQ